MLAPLAFTAMIFLEGHFVTPAIVGRRLELNALAVLLALAFWTWLWGPMGGFLSSPILIVWLVLKEHLMPDDSPQLPQGIEPVSLGTSARGASPEDARKSQAYARHKRLEKDVAP